MQRFGVIKFLQTLLFVAHFVRFADLRSTSFPSQKIINGNLASEKQVPYQVSLQKKLEAKWKHICGGTIIADHWILTAAHCFLGKWIRYRVIAGTLLYLDVEDPHRQVVDVYDFHVHPNHPFSNEGKAEPFDIGLLKLIRPLIFTDHVQPAALPFNTTDCIETKEAIVSGWGMIMWWLQIASFQLRFAIVPILPYQQCRDMIIEKVGGPVILDTTMICTLKPSNTFCHGDSGGPLVQENSQFDRLPYKVHGVASFGDSPCGFANTPDVYTSVCIYIDWIEAVIREN